jgi:hypothetical protein
MLEVARNVICLLLWLETTMGIKVLQEVSVMEMSRDPKLSLLIKEVDGLYSYLLDGHDALPEPLVWSTSDSSSSTRTSSHVVWP